VTQTNVAIVGAAGFAGRELLNILLRHPSASPTALFGSDKRSAEAPPRINDLHPSLESRCNLPVLPASVDAIAATKPHAVFLATPHEASLDLAAGMLALPTPPIVLDLSAAFRLRPASLYPRHYGFEHHHEALLARAVYGLAELNHADIAKAQLIAVPGCYPTSAILPLAPLARAGAIDNTPPVIIDSVSGASGAGRTPTAKTHFSEISLQAYNVFKHRHNPEIDQHAGLSTIFTPHLVEFDRGILSTIHAALRPGWTAQRCRDTLAAAYAGRPFVRLLPPDRWPSVAAVRNTNFCDINLAVDESRRHLIISSAIDNLVKGAAGQAVQCLNIRLGLSEHTALL
jgi:N-acetyl-gamma-glutamyl-phosphate reductase